MANIDTPKGFEVYGVCRRANRYEAGSACYPGDLVKMASDGAVDPCSAGDAAIGVALEYQGTAGGYVLVADHPDQLYVIQDDGSSIDTQTDIGLNYDILATGGNTIYKTSRQELQGTSAVSVTTSAQLQLLGIEPGANNAFGANVKCIVRINEHQFKADGLGV